jgi:transcriptional regulator with XRE-family HTH domain
MPIPLRQGMPDVLSFQEMLRSLLLDGVFTQAEMAKAIGVSTAYFNDMLHGRRLPSVAVVNRICDYMGRKTMGRREWHLAGARAHGWEV